MYLLTNSYYVVIACFSVFLSVIWSLLTSYRQRKRYRLPPGPIGFPILGILPYFDPKYPAKSIAELSKKYGSVFSGYMGSYRTVFLNDYKTIKEVLSQADDAFSDRPQIAFFELYGEGKGIGCCYVDNHWKEQRRFLLRSLRNFGMGKCQGLLRDKITSEAKCMVEGLAQVKGPVDPDEILSKAVCNIISQFVFGKRFEYENNKFDQFIADLKRVFYLSDPGGLTSYLPFMRYVPFSGYNDLGLCARRLEAGLFKKEIDHHIQNFDLDREPADMIDCFLKELERKKKESPSGVPDEKETGFTYANLMHMVGDAFAGGTDTTSTAILWTLVFAVRYDKEQRMMQEEIDRVVGRDRLPDLEDKPNMPITQAFLAETLRFMAAGPFGLPHGVWKDTTINGYDIPKGTVIVPNLYSALHDPELFSNPAAFDPTRFIDDHGKLKLSLLDKTNAQFGLGRRSCPGMDLGQMQRFLFFTTLLHRFHLNAPGGHESISLDWIHGMSVVPLPFKLLLEPR